MKRVKKGNKKTQQKVLPKKKAIQLDKKGSNPRESNLRNNYKTLETNTKREACDVTSFQDLSTPLKFLQFLSN